MSQRIEDGGAAFPCEQGHTPEGTWNQSFDPGMSLRDYFAGQALAGMATSAGFQGAPWDKLAADAYEAANAMIRARQMGAQTGGEAHG